MFGAISAIFFKILNSSELYGELVKQTPDLRIIMAISVPVISRKGSGNTFDVIAWR